MKVEIEASELKNAKISKISLVTNAATRSPFKIIKTRELPVEKAKTGGIAGAIGRMIGKEVPGVGDITAILVRKDAVRHALPVIRANGFRVEKEHAELLGDVLLLKQEGFDPEVDLPLIAITEDIAVQLPNVTKYFDPYPAGSDFSDNINAGAFWPGMHAAFESLSESVWSTLNEAESPDDAAVAVAKQVKSFSAYLNNLVADLPTTVFKMERELLTKKFEGSNVSSSNNKTTDTPTEEEQMRTAVLKEAAAGDLDGLLDDAPAADAALAVSDEIADSIGIEKSGDEGAPQSGGSPGNPVVDNTSDTGAASLDEGGVPAGFRKGEVRVTKQFDLEAGEVIEKFAAFLINETTDEEIFWKFVDVAPAPVVDRKSDYTPAENALFAQMGVLAKGIIGIKESIDAQGARIDAVEKSASTAQETANNTVVMVTDDIDQSLASMAAGSRVSKQVDASIEKADLWNGVLTNITRAAA